MTRIINDWMPETKSLLATLRQEGFTIVKGSNGGDSFRLDSFPTEADFLEELLGCDEAYLFIRRNGTKDSVREPGKRVYCLYSLWLVLGNSPGELVADYGIPANLDDANALDKATKEHFAKWEGKAQPTLEVSY